MTTLPQLVKEQSFVLDEKDEAWSPEDIINIVEEWLKDKRQTNSEIRPCPRCNQCSFGINQVIDDLLKELTSYEERVGEDKK